MNLHFDMLKFILQILLHSNSALRSFCRESTSCLDFIFQKILASSAYNCMNDVQTSQITFMYNTNNNGSPDVAAKGDDTLPSIITD